MQRFIFTAPALTYDPAVDGSSGEFITDVSMSEIDLRLSIDNGSDLPKPYQETHAPPSALEAALVAQGAEGRILTGGEQTGPKTYDFFFGVIDLENATTAEILTISETGSTVEYVVQIGGDPLDLTTPEQANAVFESVTSVVSIPSGDISRLLLARPVDLDTDGTATRPGLDLEGTLDDDILVGTADADTLSGLDGADRLDGGAGGDRLFGGSGADGLLGRGGDDLLRAGPGRDTVAASFGDDTVFGGSGRDMIGGGRGNDLLQGDADNDTLGGGYGNDEILGGFGDDVLAAGAGRDTLFGESGSDTIGASYGDDFVYGGEDDDSLGGGSELDILEGGDGNDTIGGGLGTDSVFGGSGDDFLAGGSGDDTVVGDAGDDTLNAGDGSDALYGGGGHDVFVWNAPDPGARDVIYDFSPEVDKIRLVGIESIEDLNVEIPPTLTIIAHDTFDDEGLSGQEPDIESVILEYGGQEIVLQGVQAGELDASQFIFL